MLLDAKYPEPSVFSAHFPSFLIAAVVIVPAVILSAEIVPVYMPLASILVRLGPPVILDHECLTLYANVTFPSFSHLMFPPAIGPEPTDKNFHLLPMIPEDNKTIA